MCACTHELLLLCTSLLLYILTIYTLLPFLTLFICTGVPSPDRRRHAAREPPADPAQAGHHGAQGQVLYFLTIYTCILW